MRLELHKPFIITPRILAGLKIGKDSYISIAYGHTNGEGRMCYSIWIDIGEKEFYVDDLKSGCRGSDLQEGMTSLLSFLGAAADAYRYEMGGRKSDNSDLFVPEVVEWAYQNSDEISMLAYEISESPALIVEK